MNDITDKTFLSELDSLIKKYTNQWQSGDPPDLLSLKLLKECLDAHDRAMEVINNFNETAMQELNKYS